MNLHVPIGLEHSSRRVRWVMGIAWLLIALKCWIVSWAVSHWRMPFDAWWIIAPTIAFAALATVLWLGHREE